MTERSSREGEGDEHERVEQQQQQQQQQEQQEPVLRKSCDYCARMKRACDGGSPCSLCCRRGKVCERRLRRKSGPAKGAKYAPRRRKLDNEVALTQAEAAAAAAAAEAAAVAATTITAMKANESGGGDGGDGGSKRVPRDGGSGDGEGRATTEPRRHDVRTKTQSGHGNPPSGAPWPKAGLRSPTTRPLEADARAKGREEGSPAAQQQGAWGIGEWAKGERRGSGCSDGGAVIPPHGVPPKKRFPSKGGVVRGAEPRERQRAAAHREEVSLQEWQPGGRERGPWAVEGAGPCDRAGRDEARRGGNSGTITLTDPRVPYSSYSSPSPAPAAAAAAAASHLFSRGGTQEHSLDPDPRPVKTEEVGPIFSPSRGEMGREGARGARPVRRPDHPAAPGVAAAAAASSPREAAEPARHHPTVREGPRLATATAAAAAAAGDATQGERPSPQVKEEHALESMVGRVVSVSPLKRPREEDAHAGDGRYSKPQVPAWEPAMRTGGIGLDFRPRVGPATARQQNWGSTQAPHGQQPLAPKDLLFRLRPNDEDMIDIIAKSDRRPATSSGGRSSATPGNGIGVVQGSGEVDQRRAWSESRTCVEAGELLRAIRRDSAPDAPAAAAAAAAATPASPSRPAASEDKQGAAVSSPSSMQEKGERSGIVSAEPGATPHRFKSGLWHPGGYPPLAGHSGGRCTAPDPGRDLRAAGGSDRPPPQAAYGEAAGDWRGPAHRVRAADGFVTAGRGHGAVDIPTTRAHLTYGGGGGGSSGARNGFSGYASVRHSADGSALAWRYEGSHSLPFPGLAGDRRGGDARNTDAATAAAAAAAAVAATATATASFLRPRDYFSLRHILPRQQADHQAHQASLHHRALVTGALACDGVVEAGGGVRTRSLPSRGDWSTAGCDPPVERPPYERFAPTGPPAPASLSCGRGGPAAAAAAADVSVEEYWKGNRWSSRSLSGIPVPASHGRSDGPLRKRGLIARS